MIKRTLITLSILLVGGCDNGEQNATETKQYTLPEVNEENCKKENVAQMPDQYVAEFSSMCLRQSNATPSEHKEW